MKKDNFIRLLICIGCLSILVYSYINEQNAMTRLQLDIPKVAKEIRDLQEENTRLQYEIDLFESPAHLIELSRHTEFAHLKHPMLKDIVSLQEALALQPSSLESGASVKLLPRLTLAIGVK